MPFNSSRFTRASSGWRPSAHTGMAATLALAVAVSGGLVANSATKPQTAAVATDGGEELTSTDGRVVSTIEAVNLISDRDALLETGVTLASMSVGLSTLSGNAYQDNTLRAAGLDVPEDNREAGGRKSLPGGILLSHPVSSTRISSPFGMRKNPTGPGYQFHVGQDYPVPMGTPVRAAADGTVRFAGWHRTGGMRVEIDHGHGVVTAYSHNSRLAVRVGDQIKAGDLIAAAGSTGNSTGPHVHFEVIIDGRWVNPADYLPALPNQPKSMTEEELRSLYEVDGPANNEASSSPSADASEPAPSTSAPSNGSSSSSPSSNSGTSTPPRQGGTQSPSTGGGSQSTQPSPGRTGGSSTPSTNAPAPSTPSAPATTGGSQPAPETGSSNGAGASSAPAAPAAPEQAPAAPEAAGGSEPAGE